MTTKIENLINPQVMADMISASLPAKLKFAPLAKVDTTLAARPGNTITIPRYEYIGEAEDVAEGVAMGTTVLTASTTEATVKKAGKAVELTDEAVLSGYGDPVGEANNQLKMSVADKIDSDCYTALKGASLAYDGSASVIGYEGIVKAVDLFEEEDDDAIKVILVHPKQVTTLRLDPDFKDIKQYPLQTVMTGTVGEIAGCQVVKSKKVALEGGNYICPIVNTKVEEEELPAISIFMKRDVMVESDRDILKKTTVVSVDEHYIAALTNEAKVVVAKFKA